MVSVRLKWDCRAFLPQVSTGFQLPILSKYAFVGINTYKLHIRLPRPLLSFLDSSNALKGEQKVIERGGYFILIMGAVKTAAVVLVGKLVTVAHNR